MVLDVRRTSDLRRGLRLRIFLDGEEVERCTYADGRRGVIRQFVVNETGHIASHDGVPMKRERRGRVTWRPRT